MVRFLDPRVDFAFQKIFGNEATKEVLKSFLEAILDLHDEKRILELQILNPYQLPKLELLKTTVLDVKCFDARGVSYLVEMQIKKTEAFLKRVQYNVSKAYVGQINKGEEYPKLNQVIGITITDFVLFPKFPHALSCHTNREKLTNEAYLDEILYYFLELPKFNKEEHELRSAFDKWTYFLKQAGELKEIPPVLREEPYSTAFEIAEVARMSKEEYELYDKASMLIADYRGSLELAWKEGKEEGRKEGKEEGRQEVIISMVRQGLRKGMALKDLSELTGLSVAEIEKIKCDSKN